MNRRSRAQRGIIFRLFILIAIPTFIGFSVWLFDWKTTLLWSMLLLCLFTPKLRIIFYIWALINVYTYLLGMTLTALSHLQMQLGLVSRYYPNWIINWNFEAWGLERSEHSPNDMGLLIYIKIYENVADLGALLGVFFPHPNTGKDDPYLYIAVSFLLACVALSLVLIKMLKHCREYHPRFYSFYFN